MIPFEEALEKILDKVQPMPAREVPLAELLGLVIAKPVIARVDSPPFDNSAVDGFGVRLSDVAAACSERPARLVLKKTIRAGDSYSSAELAGNSALKILTGAPVPAGVEAVVMREFCDEQDGCVLVKSAAKPGENIRRRGGEFLRGQTILGAGCVATPPVVSLIASMGYTEFSVHKRPRAAVITTGDELTKPGRPLQPGKIYDSNSVAMSTSLQCLGVRDILKLHAAENLKSTRAVFKRALAFADIIVSTGGVSVGDYDFVKEALEQLAVQTFIWRIAIKPGKPVYFGVFTEPSSGRRRYVFGLPGNPVSALVTFHTLVVPAIRKLMGDVAFADQLMLPARLGAALRKKAGRLEFVRGRVYTASDGTLAVDPTVGQDSHMLTGLANANALIVFPLERETLSAGEIVQVRLLNWSPIV
jgi:molybdopterin molybdotransferase